MQGHQAKSSSSVDPTNVLCIEEFTKPDTDSKISVHTFNTSRNLVCLRVLESVFSLVNSSGQKYVNFVGSISARDPKFEKLPLKKLYLDAFAKLASLLEDLFQDFARG